MVRWCSCCTDSHLQTMIEIVAAENQLTAHSTDSGDGGTAPSTVHQKARLAKLPEIRSEKLHNPIRTIRPGWPNAIHA